MLVVRNFLVSIITIPKTIDQFFVSSFKSFVVFRIGSYSGVVHTSHHLYNNNVVIVDDNICRIKFQYYFGKLRYISFTKATYIILSLVSLIL